MIKSISKICFCCLLLWFFGSYLTLNFRVNCLDFCLIFCLSFQNQTSEWYPMAFVPIDQHAHQPSCLLLLLWRLFGCFFKASPNYILNVGTRHSYPSLVFSDGWCVWWHWLWCQSRSQCNLCPPPPAPETGHSRHPVWTLDCPDSVHPPSSFTTPQHLTSFPSSCKREFQGNFCTYFNSE